MEIYLNGSPFTFLSRTTIQEKGIKYNLFKMPYYQIESVSNLLDNPSIFFWVYDSSFLTDMKLIWYQIMLLKNIAIIKEDKVFFLKVCGEINLSTERDLRLSILGI